MKKVSVIALFLILALCLTGAASAAPKYKLLFGHTLTENDAFHKGMVAWAEAVAKEKAETLKGPKSPRKIVFDPKKGE